eukprot:621401-Pyramimonas_sp.AAC.1
MASHRQCDGGDAARHGARVSSPRRADASAMRSHPPTPSTVKTLRCMDHFGAQEGRRLFRDAPRVG